MDNKKIIIVDSDEDSEEYRDAVKKMEEAYTDGFNDSRFDYDIENYL